MPKTFILSADDIRPNLGPDTGCVASDRITVDGALVGHFYRSPPRAAHDSGWTFLAGDESQGYLDIAANLGLYAVNTIANYDERILPYLDAPVGAAFAFDRSGGTFVAVPYPCGDA